MQLWLALAGVDNTLANKALLTEIVDERQGASGARRLEGSGRACGTGTSPPRGSAAVLEHVRSLDPDHPLAIIEAPRPLSGLKPYAEACDIHGVDIYPVSVPPGKHAGRANKDISVVGDVTRIVQEAKPSQTIWTTLQIAWSGVLPPRNQLVFPTLQQARFMAYDADHRRSARAVLLRRPPARGDDAAGPRARVQLDVLAERAEAADAGARRAAARRRRCSHRTRRSE